MILDWWKNISNTQYICIHLAHYFSRIKSLEKLSENNIAFKEVRVSLAEDFSLEMVWENTARQRRKFWISKHSNSVFLNK